MHLSRPVGQAAPGGTGGGYWQVPFKASKGETQVQTPCWHVDPPKQTTALLHADPGGTTKVNNH